METMDPSVDPCQDFYRFACGKFLREGKIPKGSSKLEMLTPMNKELMAKGRQLLDEEYKECYQSKKISISKHDDAATAAEAAGTTTAVVVAAAAAVATTTTTTATTKRRRRRTTTTKRRRVIAAEL